MENKVVRVNYESNENKAKTFWRNVGIGVLSVLIAALTVLVISLR